MSWTLQEFHLQDVPKTLKMHPGNWRWGHASPCMQKVQWEACMSSCPPQAPTLLQLGPAPPSRLEKGDEAVCHWTLKVRVGNYELAENNDVGVLTCCLEKAAGPYATEACACK